MPGRFLAEIQGAFDVLSKPPEEEADSPTMLEDGTILKDGAELCKEHNVKMEYYCQTCKVPICSECHMFGGDKHKGHQFMRLKDVYDKHCDVIKKEA